MSQPLDAHKRHYNCEYKSGVHTPPQNESYCLDPTSKGIAYDNAHQQLFYPSKLDRNDERVLNQEQCENSSIANWQALSTLYDTNPSQAD